MTLNIFQLIGTGRNSHGTFVAGIAAGTYGAGATMGVAPEASLHLHRIRGNVFNLAWWATGTTDAEGDGAVVQNNSWGFDDDSETGGVFDITNLTTYKQITVQQLLKQWFIFKDRIQIAMV